MGRISRIEISCNDSFTFFFFGAALLFSSTSDFKESSTDLNKRKKKQVLLNKSSLKRVLTHTKSYSQLYCQKDTIIIRNQKTWGKYGGGAGNQEIEKGSMQNKIFQSNSNHGLSGMLWVS